jgi:glycosyltransferase involved in cell wall biosynthesis
MPAALTPALDILRAEATLSTAFLLRHAAVTGSAAFTEERAERFLLWFALEGRHEYTAVSISPDYLGFLAAPAPPYATRLAAHVAAAKPELRQRFRSNVDLFQAWYYGGGAASLGLLPLLSQAERRFLREPHPVFESLSPALDRATYYAYLRDPAARATYDLTRPEHRDAVAAACAATGDPLEPLQPEPAPESRGPLPGCNIIGFAEGVLGIGEDARAVATALGHAGIHRCICNLTLPDRHATSAPSQMEALYVGQPLFPINIFAMTAFETARLAAQRGASLRSGRYNIGYWPWELTSLPEEWRFVFDLVDEVWAPSRFLVEVYSGLTPKPVILMPPCVAVPPAAPMDLTAFGIEPGNIVFLTMFDFNSFIARKNPQAAIAAFKAAFPNADGPERMIVKSLNAHAHDASLKDIQQLIGDDDRFVLLDGAFSRAEVGGLIAAADCFVSLHRAEGFGRVIAEAMLLRTPVVATNWSGSVDFLKADTGFPVDGALRPVAPEEYVFWEGSDWAEPSLASAAAALRRVAARPAGIDTLLDNAQMRISSTYDLASVSRRLAARIAEISERWG